jgi:hypothetical protein
VFYNARAGTRSGAAGEAIDQTVDLRLRCNGTVEVLMLVPTILANSGLITMSLATD